MLRYPITNQIEAIKLYVIRIIKLIDKELFKLSLHTSYYRKVSTVLKGERVRLEGGGGISLPATELVAVNFANGECNLVLLREL